MNTFWIFALVVTVLYAIYYTVIICIDLYSKPKERRDNTEESFDVGDMAPEESKAVEETEHGFRIGQGGEDGQKQWKETSIPSIRQDANIPSPENDVKLDASGAPMTPAQQKIEATQKEMAETEPEMTGEMSSELLDEELQRALSSGNSQVKITKEPSKADNQPDNTTPNNINNNVESHKEESEDAVADKL